MPTDSIRESTDVKGKRGTEVPRPFGFAHKGASALTSVCRTVDAVAPISDWDGSAPSAHLKP